MHVTLTNPYCWPYVHRGSEAVIHGLAAWLGANGVGTEVVAGGPVTDRHAITGVDYVTLRARDLRRVSKQLDPEVTFIPAMARRLRRMAPDVVHSFLYTDAAAARLAHRPYILSVGGIALRSSFAGQRLKLRLFELARSGAAAIVCPSQAAARHLRDEYGHDAEVIPNGLDVERFRVDLQRRPGRIFCAATPNDNRKRPHVLVEAFGILAERGIDAELVFAGAVSASRRDELLHRLPESVRNRVSFAGEVAEDEVVRLYAGSTVTCLPSLNEAFGMVVVESLAAGTPVVGTDHGAIPELLSAEVGRMFAPDDPDACASGLQHFLELESSAALQMACRARAAAFDWSVVGPRFLDLYRRVLERQAVDGTLPKKNE